MRALYLLFISLAARNGHASFSSSESLRDPVPHTTTADEYDSRLSSCTRCSKMTCQVIHVSYNMEGKER